MAACSGPLAFVRDQVLRQDPEQPALTTSERSEHGCVTCTYGETLDRAGQLAAAVDGAHGELGANACAPGAPRRRLVICGDGVLHAIGVLACSLAEFVPVLVPYEASQDETLCKLQLVQRACDAAATVVSEHLWATLDPLLPTRSPLSGGAVVAYSHVSGESRIVVRAAACKAQAPGGAPSAAAPDVADPALVFHRRGRHTTLWLSPASLQAYVCHGVAPLLHAVDPLHGAALVAQGPAAAPRGCLHIGSCGHLLPTSESHESSIRASHNGCSDRRRPVSRASSLSSLCSVNSVEDAADAAAAVMIKPASHGSCTGLPGTSTPGRKARANGAAPPHDVCGAAGALAAQDSEVIPACPVASSPSPAQHRGGLAPPPESPMPMSVVAPAAMPQPPQPSAFDDDAPLATLPPALLPELTPRTPTAACKAAALERVPSDEQPGGRRSRSVIPSELYAGEALRSRQTSRAPSPEPRTVTREQPGGRFGRPPRLELGALAAASVASHPLTGRSSVCEPAAAREAGSAHVTDCLASTSLHVPEITPRRTYATPWCASECSSLCPESPTCLRAVPCARRLGADSDSDSDDGERRFSAGRPLRLPAGVSPYVCDINPLEDDSAGLGAFGGADEDEGSSREGPLLAGGSFGEQSLQWRDNAWTASTRRTAAAAHEGASAWQPHVLCALPTDAPAGLLFGLLAPLMLGWHVILESPGFAPGAGRESVESAWAALHEHGAALDGALLTAAHCDAFTRCAMQAIASEADPWAKPGGARLSLAALRACAVFGPCLTPPVAQSFLATMQPFGLRRSSVSVVCSTWELPCVCPPLLGLHTMTAGVRCSVGDVDSPVASVRIIDSHTRAPLPDGSVGNVWVGSPGEHGTVVRGPGVPAGQWVFDAAQRSRSGPYHVSGLAGYVSEGRLFVVGRVADMLFTHEASQHASDLEAFVAGLAPTLPHGRFALVLPDKHAADAIGALPASDGRACKRALRRSMQRGSAAGEGGRKGRLWGSIARKLSSSPGWLAAIGTRTSSAAPSRLSDLSLPGRSCSFGGAPRFVEGASSMPQPRSPRQDRLRRCASAAAARSPPHSHGLPLPHTESPTKAQIAAALQPKRAVLLVQQARGKRRGARDAAATPRRSFVGRVSSCFGGGRGGDDAEMLGCEDLGRSLAQLKQKFGVDVAEVWGVDGALPATPMGTADRCAAQSLPGRVSVYDVDTDAGRISARSPFC